MGKIEEIADLARTLPELDEPGDGRIRSPLVVCDRGLGVLDEPSDLLLRIGADTFGPLLCLRADLGDAFLRAAVGGNRFPQLRLALLKPRNP